MDDRLSLEIIRTNQEYIEIQQRLKVYHSHKNAVLNLVRYIASGNIRYAVDRIIGSFTRKRRSNITNLSENGKPEARIYGELYDINKSKVAVYTVVTGGYDLIKEPFYLNDKIDYYCFTDGKPKKDSAWKYISIDSLNLAGVKGLSAKEISRYLKFKPHEILNSYDFSIYIDGSVRIMADLIPIIEGMKDKIIGIHQHSGRYSVREEGTAIKALGKSDAKAIKDQIKRYTTDGFDDSIGLFQCSIIVRQHNHPKCVEVMDLWWEEYKFSRTKRDQLSFPYVLWKSNVTSDDIYVIGKNWETNPRFRVYSHNDI